MTQQQRKVIEEGPHSRKEKKAGNLQSVFFEIDGRILASLTNWGLVT